MSHEEKERLREMHRQCFLLLTNLADIQKGINKLRREVLEIDDTIVEKLDE